MRLLHFRCCSVDSRAVDSRWPTKLQAAAASQVVWRPGKEGLDQVSISSQAYTSSFEALSAVDFCHFPGCLSCHRDPGRFGFPIAWESASSDEDELWEAKESGLISQSSMSFMTGRIDPTLLLPSGQGVRPGVLSGCLYLMFLSGRQKPVLDTWDFFPSSKKLSP